MKIGILSMQRVDNYGSFWQAFCLRELIKDISKNTAEFIDIIPGELETRVKHKKTFSINKITRIPYYMFQRKKHRMFKTFQKDILCCGDEPNYSSDYESIIIGSDEVFNFIQKSPWGFSTQLYGNIKNNNVNSYAACFGNTTIKDIQETNRYEVIRSSMMNMKHISVRDHNSSFITQQLTGNKPEIHLDPVMVGSLPIDLPEIEDKNYILIYSYDFRFSDENIIKQIREIAKRESLKVLSVGFYQKWVDKNIIPNPMELLAYFKNATYVFTDTFHGTIFASRMHKSFLTIVRESNNQKLNDLLFRIGMEDRKISKNATIDKMIDMQIDYEQYEALRKKERERSIKYLEKCLDSSVNQ